MHKPYLNLNVNLRPALLSAAVLLAAISQPAQALAQAKVSAEPCETLDCLQKAVDKYAKAALAKNQFVGMSVVVVKREDNGTFASFKSHFGYRDAANKLPPNDSTVYELASITKPVTFLTLAVQDKIKLTDSIGPYLPEGVRNPKPNGKDIRFEHLLSHSAEIMSVSCVVLPDESVKCFGEPLDLRSPYKNLTEQEFYKFIDASAQMYLDFPTFFASPGHYEEYSNMGSVLFGALVARAHGMSYEEYVREKILGPLKMSDSILTMPCTDRPNCDQLAKVYEWDKTKDSWQQTHWRVGPFAKGSGLLKSSVNDMEKFLKANLAPESTPIAKALKRSQRPLVDVTATLNSNLCGKGQESKKDRCNSGMHDRYWGWQKAVSGPFLWHNGANTGSQAMMIYTMDGTFGVVVLENSIDPGSMEHAQDFASCVMMTAGKMRKLDWCKRFDG